MHSVHPCTSPSGRLRRADRQSCRSVEPAGALIPLFGVSPNFGATSKTGSPIPRSQACYSCHDEHAGKTDTVFTQFYPTLKEAHARIAATP
mgnify:CR=1 FL=1